jgi:GxxExxY protein
MLWVSLPSISVPLCVLRVFVLKLAMHENEISEKIIGAAIEVHRELGPGLIEKLYENALCHELQLRGVSFKRQQPVPVYYKGVSMGDDLWLDLLVAEKVNLDLKAKEQVTPFDKAKLLTYLRLSDLRLGLLINFHEVILKNGIKRVINGELDNPGAGNASLY